MYLLRNHSCIQINEDPITVPGEVKNTTPVDRRKWVVIKFPARNAANVTLERPEDPENSGLENTSRLWRETPRMGLLFMFMWLTMLLTGMRPKSVVSLETSSEGRLRPSSSRRVERPWTWTAVYSCQQCGTPSSIHRKPLKYRPSLLSLILLLFSVIFHFILHNILLLLMTCHLNSASDVTCSCIEVSISLLYFSFATDEDPAATTSYLHWNCHYV